MQVRSCNAKRQESSDKQIRRIFSLSLMCTGHGLKSSGVLCSSPATGHELDTSADRAAAGAAEVASPHSAEANGEFRLLLATTRESACVPCPSVVWLVTNSFAFSADSQADISSCVIRHPPQLLWEAHGQEGDLVIFKRRCLA